MSEQSIKSPNINMSIKEITDNSIDNVKSGVGSVNNGVGSAVGSVGSAVGSAVGSVNNGVDSVKSGSNGNMGDVIVKYLVIIPFTILLLSLIIFFIIYINEKKDKINSDNIIEYIIKYPDYVSDKFILLMNSSNDTSNDTSNTKKNTNVNKKANIKNDKKNLQVTPPPPKPKRSQKSNDTYNISNPTPDSVTSNTQTKKIKGGYCYIGEDRGYRSCVKVEDSNKCMSGEIFPSKDLCINANLR